MMLIAFRNTALGKYRRADNGMDMIGLGGLADRAKDVLRSEVSGKVGGTRGGGAHVLRRE